MLKNAQIRVLRVVWITLVMRDEPLFCLSLEIFMNILKTFQAWARNGSQEFWEKVTETLYMQFVDLAACTKGTLKFYDHKCCYEKTNHGSQIRFENIHSADCY